MVYLYGQRSKIMCTSLKETDQVVQILGQKLMLKRPVLPTHAQINHHINNSTEQ